MEHAPPTRTAPGTGLLSSALAANGAFSFGTGLLLAIAPGTVSDWLGLDIAGWLRIFGVALIGHGFLIAFVLRTQQENIRRWGLMNLLSVAPYPVLMIIVVATVVSTDLGRLLLLLDGAIVGLFAVGQWLGLRSQPVVATAT